MSQSPDQFPDTPLKPCPFCGETDPPGEGVFWEEAESVEGGIVRIYCESCGDGSPWRDDTPGGHLRALNEWNTRPIEDALRAQMAELQTRFDSLLHQRAAQISAATLSGFEVVTNRCLPPDGKFYCNPYTILHMKGDK